MNASYIFSLGPRIDSLSVFRGLLNDPVMNALRDFLKDPEVSTYSGFVSLLYESGMPTLGAYIRDICWCSENIYVRTVGQRAAVPECIKKSLSEELDILQAVSELRSEELKSLVKWDGFLPDFDNDTVSLKQDYMHRAENISRYGYGIYAKNRMFYSDDSGAIIPVIHPDNIRMSDLVDYKEERQIVIDNTKALLAGKPAANILLTGDAGTGKSSTVKAVGNELYAEGLRIIEVKKNQLRVIPSILDTLACNPLKFIIFVDDLSFSADDDNFSALKAVLEGSVSAKSRNVVIYATSNRRHIVKETFSDRNGDDIHRNDTMQELISLSERFGIHITFQKPNKETFLHIVRMLAEKNGVEIEPSELEARAERFALGRGGRSARLARQFIDELVSSGNGD